MGAIIMVVDDSAMIRMQVKRTLTGAGFEVVDARDGQDAADQIAAGTQPAMIVCDVNMPRMNGLEFLEFLQGSSCGAPVIMLTTEGQPELIRKARALGAKGWLVKPFKPDLLLGAARKICAMAA